MKPTPLILSVGDRKNHGTSQNSKSIQKQKTVCVGDNRKETLNQIRNKPTNPNPEVTRSLSVRPSA